VDLYSALSLRTGDALKMRQEAAVANSWPRHGRCALSLARLVLTPSADQSRRLIDDELARCVELRPPSQPASQPDRISSLMELVMNLAIGRGHQLLVERLVADSLFPRQSPSGIQLLYTWDEMTSQTIRSPFCGCNLAQCVELMDGDLPC